MSVDHRPAAFYAFPSQPDQLVETIELAISDIDRTSVCNLQSWRSLNITGKVVINTILKQISRSSLFLADLTGLNPNVLFELGFAVAKHKRVWLTVDKTDPGNRSQLDQLELISDLGYVEHENYETIRDAFMRDYPYADLESTLLSDYQNLIDSLQSEHKQRDVFYLPSAIDSTASKQLSRYLGELKIQVVKDDALENSYEPLTWYLQNLLDSRTVITHLENPARPDSIVNNAKYSFIAGLARGFDIPVIMLAPEPFDPPFDYRGLLFVYRTGAQCIKQIKTWLEPKLVARQPGGAKRSQENTAEDITTTLLRFHIGESTAENEENALSDYFVQTGYFARGIETPMGVFIGRKGTGKTANLYQIRRHFQNERNDLTVTVKPVSFRLESFVQLLTDIFTERDDTADFVERVWRVVIYSDLAQELANRLTEKPSYYSFSEAEQTLLQHVEKHGDFIRADFGEKMNTMLELAQQAREQGQSPKRILGIISSEYADPLLSVFEDILVRFQRVIILVDNLDKAWDIQRNVTFQAQIVFGLLGFQNTLRRDLKWSQGDVRLLIFLREDIFSYVVESAREPDKIRLSTTRITWDDPEQLSHVLEERFVRSGNGLARSEVWSKLFCESVNGTSAKEYLLQHTMPRPRDLIHVVKTAISNAINRDHLQIEASDIRDALGTYFNFLLDNLTTEYGLYYENLRGIVMQFVQAPVVHTPRNVERRATRVLGSRQKARDAVAALVHVSFFGVRRAGKTRFAYSSEEAARLQVLVKGSFRRFPPPSIRLVIHPAFRHGLDVDAGNGQYSHRSDLRAT